MTTSQKNRLPHENTKARREAWYNSDDRPLIVGAYSRLNNALYFSHVPAVFPDFRKRVFYTPPSQCINDVRRFRSLEDLDKQAQVHIDIDIETFALRFGGSLTTWRA